MEVRYEAVAYTIQWQNLNNAQEIGYVNPNASRVDYNYERDGVVTLLPATFTNPNITFLGWEYQDTNQEDEFGHAKWALLEDNKLMMDTDELTFRIQPRIEFKKFKVEFEVEDLSGTKLEFSDVVSSMTVLENLMTIDGTSYTCETQQDTRVFDLSKEYKIECMSGWANFFYELNAGYSLNHMNLNGELNSVINDSHMNPPYVSINGTDLSKDSVVTFVVTVSE